MHDDQIKTDRMTRWRLILGSGDADGTDTELGESFRQIDQTLEALYDSTREGGLGSSSPAVSRWLGDIRSYFPSSVVKIMQKDAMDRLGLSRMLLEPELLESVEADVELVATLISLNQVIPVKTKDTARKVVAKVVEELERKIKLPLIQTLKGALNKSVQTRRPKWNEIDWHRTIQANLKHYQPKYKTIIPEKQFGFGRKGGALKEIILCVDQSGSMASSVVYASIFGAVLASIRSLKTHMIAFDTSVVELTENLHDPVELLFGVQLGGGTDIHKALTYCQQLIRRPKDTILVLITDLFEGGSVAKLVDKASEIKASGVQVITLLALNDEGKPFYHQEVAQAFTQLEIPTFGCTPDAFGELMAAAISGGGIGYR